MRRQQVSINQLQNGRYQLSYRDPFTNKRVRKRFNTYKDAKEFEKQIKNMFQNSNNEHLQALKIKELMELHFQKCPATKVDLRRIAYESFMENFGEIELRHFSTVELKVWLDQLKTEREWAEITVAHVKGNLNHFFNYLIDEGVISKSPLETYKINRSAPPKKPRVFLTSEEIRMILKNAKEFSPHFLYPFFMGLIHTGARRQEIINLEWKDVDLAQNLLHLRDVKNGSARPVKLSPPLRKLLESLQRVSKFVFCSPENDVIGRSQLYRHIQSFKYTYPFHKDWGCHAFRHSFAYNFLKKGGQMYELMAVLGHKNIGLTINLYGKLRSEDVENPSPYEFD